MQAGDIKPGVFAVFAIQILQGELQQVPRYITSRVQQVQGVLCPQILGYLSVHPFPVTADMGLEAIGFAEEAGEIISCIGLFKGSVDDGIS